MIQKLANARNAKRISKFLNENSNAKQFIQNRNGIKRRVLAEPKTSIKDIIADIKKDIKSSQNQGIKANANALRANYTNNAIAKNVINLESFSDNKVSNSVILFSSLVGKARHSQDDTSKCQASQSYPRTRTPALKSWSRPRTYFLRRC